MRKMFRFIKKWFIRYQVRMLGRALDNLERKYRKVRKNGETDGTSGN